MAVAVVAAACAACGGRSDLLPGALEGSAGAPVDVGTIRSQDAGGPTADGGTDAAVIPADSGPGPDASPRDSGADVSVRDARPDMSLGDAGRDASPDAAVDAPADAPQDASQDADAADTSPPRCAYDWECDDGVGCTLDACEPGTGTCAHLTMDDWCPVGHRCTLDAGCEASVVANSAYLLYQVSVPTGTVVQIGNLREAGRISGRQIADTARHPDGTLLVDDFSHVLLVDEGGEIIETVADHDTQINALGCAADGSCYGADADAVHRIDIDTGEMEIVALLPDGHRSSGDLAVIEDRILVTTRDAADTDMLVSIAPSTRQVVVLGELGYACVYGLAEVGFLLYGFNCNGRILSINPWTAATAELVDTDIDFWGAAGHP